jgi:hypothetical protein
LDRDDPAIDEALADVEAEMATLGDLPTPSAIADDWETVSEPPTTTPEGAVEPGAARLEAGRRIGQWAIEHCDLSPEAAAALASGID